MKRCISIGAIVLFVVMTAASAFAQDSTATEVKPAKTKLTHRYEITPYGGAVWTRGYTVLLGGQTGTLDAGATAVYGVSIGYSVRDSVTQIEVLYDRQEADLVYKLPDEEIAVGKASIEHLHVGCVLGAATGRTVWFTTISLGTTRWAPKEGDDEWRFSLMLGLGAKYPINERFGIRVQGRVPFTWVDDTAKFYCGDSGCITSGGGRTMWQFDLSAGLIIKL